MIQWSLTLTSNQIQILEALEGRVFGEKWENEDHISHWIVGCRVLEREGLLRYEHHMRPGGKFMDPDRSGHFITERGRFLLNLIREDMARFLKDRDAKPRKKEAKKAA